MISPGVGQTPALRVVASLAVLALLAATLPVKLPGAAGATSSLDCLTIADQPVAGVDAVARLEQCATLVPNDVELLADLGLAYEADGRPGEAERIYLQLLKIDDEYADVHVRLARLLWLRDAAAARRHLDRALQLQPNRASIVALIEQLQRDRPR